MTTALRAERLRHPAFGAPVGDRVRAGAHPHARGIDHPVHRPWRSGAPLAAMTVAIPGRRKLRGDLEPHRPARTGTRERRFGRRHSRQATEVPRLPMWVMLA